MLYDYAKVLAVSKKLDEAIKVVDSAKKMKYFANSKRDFSLLEGQLWAECCNYEKAIFCCNECISLEDTNGFDGEARFMLMNLYLIQSDYKAALEQSTEIVKRDMGDSYYYAALYYKPFCMKQLGNVEESRKVYREANSIYRLATLNNPAAIDIYLYRAMCLKDMEEFDKAMEMLDFIVKLNDQIAEVHVIRSDIYRIQGHKSLSNEEMQKAYKLKPSLNPDQESVGC